MFHERNKIPVTAYNYYRIHNFRGANGVNNDTHIPVCFFCATVKFLQITHEDFNSLFLERVKKWFFFARFSAYYIGKRAQELSAGNCFVEYFFKIYPRVVKTARGVVHVLYVNEHSDALRGVTY